MALINTTTTGIQGSTFVADGTGSLTVQQNGQTLGVYGNIPAFSAYQSSGQSVSSGVFTKVQFQTEEYDTASCYDNATNYRFTPNVAGYYQVNARCDWSFTSGISLVSIHKNGSFYKVGPLVGATGSGAGTTVNCLVYLNGSTDYIETYVYQNNGTNTTAADSRYTYFQSFLVKAA